jgi:hypothetical protein
MTKTNNKLVCRFTGQERQSNQTYLSKKADQNGTTVDDYRAHYVAKPALLDVQDSLKTRKISEVLSQLDVSGATLEKILKYNGKSKKGLDDYKKVRYASESEDRTVDVMMAPLDTVEA